MSWQTDWLSAFGVFARVIQYRRSGSYVPVSGFSRALRTDEVVGDFDSTSLMVVIPVAALTAAGFYPPKVYDRVDIGDGIDRNVQSFKIEYAQTIPMWVKLVIAG